MKKRWINKAGKAFYFFLMENSFRLFLLFIQKRFINIFLFRDLEIYVMITAKESSKLFLFDFTVIHLLRYVPSFIIFIDDLYAYAYALSRWLNFYWFHLQLLLLPSNMIYYHRPSPHSDLQSLADMLDLIMRKRIIIN